MRSQAIVGAFVLGGVILGLAAVALFGNLSLFNPTEQAAVVFEGSIAGLSIGAPVTFRGVRVGAVESIGIEVDPKTEIAYIPVTSTDRVHDPRPEPTTLTPQAIAELVVVGLRLHEEHRVR